MSITASAPARHACLRSSGSASSRRGWNHALHSMCTSMRAIGTNSRGGRRSWKISTAQPSPRGGYAWPSGVKRPRLTVAQPASRTASVRTRSARAIPRSLRAAELTLHLGEDLGVPRLLPENAERRLRGVDADARPRGIEALQPDADRLAAGADHEPDLARLEALHVERRVLLHVEARHH